MYADNTVVSETGLEDHDANIGDILDDDDDDQHLDLDPLYRPKAISDERIRCFDAQGNAVGVREGGSVSVYKFVPCLRPPAILPPDEIGMICLRILSRIFKTIPQSKRMLVRRYPNLYRHIVQLLIAKNDGIVASAQDLLKQIVNTNRHLVPQLSSAGFFLFSMYNLAGGCSKTLAYLISISHRCQQDPDSKSALAHFLPSPVLRKCEDAKAVREVLGGEHYEPSLIWTGVQRSELRLSLSPVITALRRALAANPSLIFEVDTPYRVSYESIRNEQCVGDVYLRLLIENPLHALDDPDHLAKTLMAETSQIALRMKAKMLSAAPSNGESAPSNPSGLDRSRRKKTEGKAAICTEIERSEVRGALVCHF